MAGASARADAHFTFNRSVLENQAALTVFSHAQMVGIGLQYAAEHIVNHSERIVDKFFHRANLL
jgi:hypothetical protein